MHNSQNAADSYQIICMKWGTLYGSEYVNKLYAMIKANLDKPFRLVCLTDNNNGIRDEVECYDCPDVFLDNKKAMSGWRKLSLFAKENDNFNFVGDWLYLDLDVVITGDLEPFFLYEPFRPFVVMQNWTQPGKNIGNTSVYRFRVGCAPFLLDNIQTNSRHYLNTYNNSQTYISREIGDILHFWPDAWCQLFKVQCVPRWPQRYWQTPIIPEGCKVVAFPGNPNPHEAMVGIWNDKAHKKSFLNYKRLYKYIRPVPWIKDLWQNAEENLSKSISK